jgi:hypothetical protein
MESPTLFEEETSQQIAYNLLPLLLFLKMTGL